MFNNFRNWFSRMMIGRYGVDQLNRTLSIACLVLIVLQMIFRSQLLWLLTLIILIWLYFRMFSRNIAARYNENRRFMEATEKIRSNFHDLQYNITHFREIREQNKGYHIYKCPRCGQKIRIPKGKGHIIVRCPSCHFEFHKKS
jgi:DNA-directed RNA polymerase subunit RPC12/RpoP